MKTMYKSFRHDAIMTAREVWVINGSSTFLDLSISVALENLNCQL